ncbi:MAG: stage II sporulation protein R [Alicyclobacillus sp.]|nr:stage II sporulation protein R [Alicyclobacillus sp.]
MAGPSVGHQTQAAAPSTSSTGTAAGTALDIATPHDTPIPTDALRLRIIANSDSTVDQDTKRAVRDAIVMQVAQLVQNAKSEQQAQEIVTRALPQLLATARQVTQARGAHYAVRGVVGEEPFPTKLYGNQVYPAGDYQALVITLGRGQGQNWWCVLFPPLCFIDIADGDAVPNTAGFPDLPPLETLNLPGPDGTVQPVQVRLAALDYGEEAWKALKHWFQM